MSFPAIQTRNESVVSTAGTSHAVSLPAGIQAGDLILILANKGSTSASFNALTGWTELIDEAIANGNTIWYRKADGSEGATVTFTSSASTRSAHLSYRISDAADPGTQAPEISTVATGTSVSPDPGSLSPTGGAKNYLWITFFSDAGEEADDDTWANSAPTNYANLVQKTGGIAGTNLGAIIAAADRTANTATEDPGTFNQDASLAWRAYTVAVHPAVSAEDPNQADKRDYRAERFFRPSAQPIQWLGDATPPSGEASITLTDSGTASDSISVSVDLSLSDTGAADDQLAVSSTDPNQAVPQFATMFLEPSGSAFQLLGDATTNAPISITLTDAGTGADTVSIAAAVPLDDAGSAADTININTGVDPYQAAPLPFPSFTAPFTEPTAKPFQLLGDASGVAQISLTDSGTGEDTLSVSATLPLSDAAAGADALSVAAVVPLSDAAIGTDGVALTAAVPLADAATGDDSLSVLVAVVTDANQAIPKQFGWSYLQPGWVVPFQYLGSREAAPGLVNATSTPTVTAGYGSASTVTSDTTSTTTVGVGATSTPSVSDG